MNLSNIANKALSKFHKIPERRGRDRVIRNEKDMKAFLKETAERVDSRLLKIIEDAICEFSMPLVRALEETLPRCDRTVGLGQNVSRCREFANWVWADYDGSENCCEIHKYKHFYGMPEGNPDRIGDNFLRARAILYKALEDSRLINKKEQKWKRGQK